MISPDFWKDPDIRNLTRDERLLFIGCFSNADDEGRLLAHPAHLKAAIFMYDNDLGLDDIKQLRGSMLSKLKNLLLYENAGEEYLAFLKWSKHQKPSHPRPSDLPAPPQFTETLQPEEGETPEQLTETLQPKEGETPEALAPSQGEGRLGQSSQGKVSIGKYDFRKYFNSESDLTDFLTTKLTESISAARQKGARGEQWAIAVLEQFWNQAVGKMPSEIFMGGLDALKKYPVPVVARAFVKAGRYHGGKHGKWKYIQTIIDEEMEKKK